MKRNPTIQQNINPQPAISTYILSDSRCLGQRERPENSCASIAWPTSAIKLADKVLWWPGVWRQAWRSQSYCVQAQFSHGLSNSTLLVYERQWCSPLKSLQPATPEFARPNLRGNGDADLLVPRGGNCESAQRAIPAPAQGATAECKLGGSREPVSIRCLLV